MIKVFTLCGGEYSRYEEGVGQVFGAPGAYDLVFNIAKGTLEQVQPDENGGFAFVNVRAIPNQSRCLGALPSTMRALKVV